MKFKKIKEEIDYFSCKTELDEYYGFIAECNKSGELVGSIEKLIMYSAKVFLGRWRMFKLGIWLIISSFSK